MIELALKAGGPDNVTVIIADVIDVDFGEDDPIVGGAAGDGSDEAAAAGFARLPGARAAPGDPAAASASCPASSAGAEAEAAQVAALR